MQNSSTFYDRNSQQSWEYNILNNGITRKQLNLVDTLFYINSEFTNANLYNQKKNYQFLTTIKGGSASTIDIQLSNPFKAGSVKELSILENSEVQFYTYANTISSESSVNIIRYGALDTFTSSYIKASSIREIDFLINGYREFRYSNVPVNDESQPNGWCYEIDSTSNTGSYNWYFSSTSSVIAPTYSTFGSGLEEVSLNNNYIATLIDYDYFNLDFTFNFTGGNPNDKIEGFLVNQNDLKLGRASWGNPINFEVSGLFGVTSSLNTIATFSQINLVATNINGTKRYLVFRPNMSPLPRTTTYVANISIVSLVGGYNPLNNLQVLPATSSTTTNIDVNILDSVYNFQSVSNGVTFSLASKIGNGYFKAGIWENGVWNNGWRDDTVVADFDDIYSAFLYAYDVSWKIKISGSKTSCNSFKVGDKVAIGNIIAIDINENRNLLRDYYNITEIYINPDNSGTNWIEVSLNTTFPYRRIEKDSSNHKIKITKNVWLSGAFFNGYFSGVWNNGLFKGYPKITEMFDTHWIDGFFNGGHFNSTYPDYYFTDIKATENCQVSNITLVFGTATPPRTSGHNLLPGDYIIIDKDANAVSINGAPPVLRLYNPEYNGIVKVLAVNGNNVVIDKKQNQILLFPETGKVTRYTSSSVIQNFKFYDTNRSLLKSNESSISSSIFSFNSWIDTNYDTTRSVTLGRDFRSYESLTGKSVNRNNLYGYPTYDVLSSASRFRNSFDLNYGLYKLGTKYKLFTDFIGDGSAFNEPFNPKLNNISNFYNAGWTFSTKPNHSTDLAFNRSEAVISADSASIVSTSIQDYIDAGVTGNELYLTATNSGAILNNNKVNVAKTRYTVVEFDVVTYSITNSKFTQTNQTPYEINTIIGNGFQAPATQSDSSAFTGVLTASNIFKFDVGSQGALMNPIVNFDEFDGEVWSIDQQSNGKIIVSGNFTTYGGTPTPKPKVCRIDNGVLDMSFNPDINDFNPTYIDFIKVLVVKDYLPMFDKIFLIINYTQLMSVNSYPSVLGRVIRLEPDGTFVGTISHLQKEFNSKVTDIAVRPTDGLVVIVGLFSAFYYNSTNVFFLNKMALFEYNTSTNLSFSGYNLYSGSNSETRGFSFFDSPSTIAFLSDGSIIIGVAPKEIGSASNTNARSKFKNNSGTTYYINGIVKLNTNSAQINVDSTFLTTSSTSTNMKGFSLPSSFTLLPNTSKNFINRIKVDSLNRIYVVGNFASYNDGTFNTCINIARLASNGSYDTNFDAHYFAGLGLNSFAYDILLSNNSQILYVCGQFTSYKSISCGKVISINANGGNLINTYIGAALEPSTSIVRTMVLNGSNLIVGGTFSSYQQTPTNIVTKTITTSICGQGLLILPNDILNLAVELNLDCTGTDLGNIIINLISPAGKILNVKNTSALTSQTQFTNTIFDFMSTRVLSTGTSPYSGTFSMEKLSGIGYIGYTSNLITNISDLFTDDYPNAQGDWTIYIQNNTNVYPTLNSWRLITTYKNYTNDTSIEITPSVDLPILHFNNLNFEIGSQPTGNGESSPIYRRMSYLPITQNINHLSVQNSFRFDSVEKTSAERYTGFGSNTIKKKYEYFYNKTDLMMSIQGNGDMGGSQSMLVLDNIKMYETDMIPFFKYFEEANIYKGIQIPYEGVAPNIDYLNSDFIFVDNVTIGIDSLDSSIIDNTIICVPNVVVSASASVIVTTGTPSNIGTSSVTISGSRSIQGNVQYITSGLYLSLDSLQANSVDNPVFDGLNFSKNQTGLLPSRTYYVQAFVVTQKFLTINGALTLEPEEVTTGQFFTFSTDRLPPDYSGDYSGDYSQ